MLSKRLQDLRTRKTDHLRIRAGFRSFFSPSWTNVKQFSPSSFSEYNTFLSILTDVQGVVHAAVGDHSYKFIEDFYSMGFAAFSSRSGTFPSYHHQAKTFVNLLDTFFFFSQVCWVPFCRDIQARGMRKTSIHGCHRSV